MAYHIIGDQDTVLGYRFAGVTGSPVGTPEEASAAFGEALRDGRHRLLLITERVAEMIEGEVVAHRLTAAPPYVVVIEDVQGPTGRRRTLQELIFEAVGIRIVRGE